MRPAAQIEFEAADWLARRDAGRWRAGDDKAFEQWIAASTAHRVAYLRLEAAWRKSDRLRALNPGDLLVDEAADDWTCDAEQPLERASRVRWLGGGVAALAAASAFFMFVGAGVQYETPVGGFQRLPPLTDGSHIELNTDTKIEVAYSDAERRIDLDRGEAFFSVAKDKARPFIVDAGHYRVVAVGTAFSVYREGDAIEVLVTEGKVRIERDPALRQGTGPLLVAAGHKADIDADAPVVRSVAETEYDHQLGWREGLLVFDDQPLREVAAEFNRYNRQKLVIADPKVGDITVGGTFRPTNVAGLTRLLGPGFGVKAVPVGDDRIVLQMAE
jgi:transmembrane sensor